MLVLTRKKGERVLIGDDIVITLIDVRGDGVRIGFDAPRGVSIQRAEVLSAVTEANTEAASASAATGDLLVGLLATKPKTARPSGAGAPTADRSAEKTAALPSEQATAQQPAARATQPAKQPDASAQPPKPQPPRPQG